MKLTIKGARVIDPESHLDQSLDIHIDGKKIIALGVAPTGFIADQQIDATGLVAAPGLVDLNVALCEPGFSKKGNIASETQAAVVGGVTTLCCPPHTQPMADTPAVIDLILHRAKASAKTKVYPVGALTKGCEGEQLAELVSLSEAGCIAFTNGLTDIANNRILRQIMEYAATFDVQLIFTSQDHSLAEGGLVHEGSNATFLGLAGIPEVAETVALSRYLLLAEQTGVKAHFTQITTARGVELIAAAQSKGLPVSADVALYQLILTDDSLSDFSSIYHVQPPLRTLKDRDALREGVKHGVIQAIASHHQPHELDAKMAPFAETEPGISSVELLLPLAMTLVDEGVLDLPTLLHRLTFGPANALNLSAGSLKVDSRADIVLFDPASSTLAGEHWYSKGRNCPFIGHCLPAKVCYTLVDGRIVYQA